MVCRVRVAAFVVVLALGCGGQSERFGGNDNAAAGDARAGGTAQADGTARANGTAQADGTAQGGTTTIATPSGADASNPETSFGQGGAGTTAEPNPAAIGGAGPVGASGAAGHAGATTVTSSCTPPSFEHVLSPWQDPPPPTDLKAELERVATGMVGDWYGIVTTPWTEPYQVNLKFGDDGGYSGACVWSSDQCCVAYYYGTDLNADLKRYTVNRISSGGVVGGDIDIIFGEEGSFYESGYQGTLESIEVDADDGRLRFDFMYGGTYGPLQFDLERGPTLPR